MFKCEWAGAGSPELQFGDAGEAHYFQRQLAQLSPHTGVEPMMRHPLRSGSRR